MNKQLIETAQKVLNPVELRWFRQMYSQKGVLFIKGRPGIAKSALLQSIANKLGMVFIDIRVPTKDETDLGTYPIVRVTEKGYSVLEHAVPDWADMTKDESKNYLIVFEELNRADKPQRNAALGLLNERFIGHAFKFGTNVFMAATGNLGDEDGTDVEEFDIALSSRLIHKTWKMEGADGLMFWKESYANGRVHPDLLRFLDANPTAFYPAMEKQKDIIACPRTWTNLSEAIVNWYGMESSVDEFGTFLIEDGKDYVGGHAAAFHKYLIDNKRITLQDVLQGKYRKYDKFHRDNRAAVVNEITALNIAGLPKKELTNIIKFFKSFTESNDNDLLIGSLYDWMYNFRRSEEKDLTNMRILVKEFPEEIKYVGKTAESEPKA